MDHIPWWVWALIVWVIVAIAMRRAAQNLKTFYGGLFNFATRNPVGSGLSRAGLLYFLHRIFR
jgi:hypothetical protein